MIYAFLLQCMLGVRLTAAAEHVDTIDLGTRYQVMDNFGASDAWTIQQLGSWSEENRNKVADLLFSLDRGIALSLWRFNIGAGTNNDSIHNRLRTEETLELKEGKYDWTRQATQQWFARAARSRGVPELLGFVNSPPARMTRNGLTNSWGDETSTTNLKPGFETQYAKYLCDIVQHFQVETEADKRLVFNYLSPVNEPQVDWSKQNQEGCRASNEDIKKIVAALHDELNRRHMTTGIRGVESNQIIDLWRLNRAATSRWKSAYGDYLAVFLGDAALAQAMDHTMCYHDYDSASGAAMEQNHRKLGEIRLKYADCKLWMSEICEMSPHRDLGMTAALQLARLIHSDVALSGASAWHWWLAVSTSDYKDGLLYTDYKKPGDAESVIVPKMFWAMGNFSRFVRPGMLRVQLKGQEHSFAGLVGSAYLDVQSHRLVLVYINSAKENQKIRWSFTGNGIPDSFTPYITSAENDLKAAARVRSSSAVVVPAESVVTFVGN
jgi:O-glycosyl hydrolase